MDGGGAVTAPRAPAAIAWSNVQSFSVPREGTTLQMRVIVGVALGRRVRAAVRVLLAMVSLHRWDQSDRSRGPWLLSSPAMDVSRPICPYCWLFAALVGFRRALL